jgi:hypothetical protein
MPNEFEIAEEIAALTFPWRGPLLHFSGPVPHEQVARAEEQLGVSFPPSYRAFLRHFGTGRVHHYRLLGVGGEGLWGDVVAVNHLALPRPPAHLVRIAETPTEHTFYLDTSERDADGECPVRLQGPGAAGRLFAPNFLAFVRRICAGLVPAAWQAGGPDGCRAAGGERAGPPGG